MNIIDPIFVSSTLVVVLAAIAARTKRIRLSTAVTVLSSDDPVRVFQDFAMLDLLSQGRGSFIESYPLFGYDLHDYDELFAEKLESAAKDLDRGGRHAAVGGAGWHVGAATGNRDHQRKEHKTRIFRVNADLK